MAALHARGESCGRRERWRQESITGKPLHRLALGAGRRPRPAHSGAGVRHGRDDAPLRPGRPVPARVLVEVSARALTSPSSARGSSAPPARRRSRPRASRSRSSRRSFAGGPARPGARWGTSSSSTTPRRSSRFRPFSRRLWDGKRRPSFRTRSRTLPAGTLWVAADEEEMAHVRGKRPSTGRAACRRRSSTGALWPRPSRTSGRASPEGCACPGDRVLYPAGGGALASLERALEKGAARLRRSEDVLEVGAGLRPDRVGADRRRGGPRRRRESRTPALLPGVPVAPGKGHLVITDRQPGFCRHQLVELGYLKSAHGGARESVAFNLQPRATGQLLLGSSRELVGFDAVGEPPLVARMVRRAIEYVPAIARLPALRTWTGFRPATPDNLPLIGAMAARSGTSGSPPGTRGSGSRRRSARRASSPISHPRANRRRSTRLPYDSGPEASPMRDGVTPHVDGRSVRVAAAGPRWPPRSSASAFRPSATSVTGEPRGPLCAMGVCFECRVTIDGRRTGAPA